MVGWSRMFSDTKHAWSGTPPLPRRTASPLERVSAYLRASVWERVAGSGLHPSQARVLELLDAQGGSASTGWLARHLGVSAASASDTIAALAAKGLVNRGRGVADTRVVLVALTEAGRTLLGEFGGSLAAVEQAASRLPADAQEQLYAALLTLVETLVRSGDLPVQRMCPRCRHLVRTGDPVSPFRCGLVGAPLRRERVGAMTD